MPYGDRVRSTRARQASAWRFASSRRPTQNWPALKKCAIASACRLTEFLRQGYDPISHHHSLLKPELEADYILPGAQDVELQAL